jgi:hypothetical protein
VRSYIQEFEINNKHITPYNGKYLQFTYIIISYSCLGKIKSDLTYFNIIYICYLFKLLNLYLQSVPRLARPWPKTVRIRYIWYGGWDSTVSIETGYGLDNRGVGVWVPVGSRILTSQSRPDRLWGPPNLLHKWVPQALSSG